MTPGALLVAPAASGAIQFAGFLVALLGKRPYSYAPVVLVGLIFGGAAILVGFLEVGLFYVLPTLASLGAYLGLRFLEE